MGPIHLQAAPRPPAQPWADLLRIELLPKAIPGVATRYAVQGAGATHAVTRRPEQASVLLFVQGSGEVRAGAQAFPIDGIAACGVAGPCPLALVAANRGLEYLELTLDLTADEARGQVGQVYFIAYADCTPYGEAIKSAKTVSRTIIPPEVLPRFCMGSVETTGPDVVGAHAHPMLEQLFFGLPGNRCTVTADEAATVFEERVLLHIPLASSHGVTVEAGSHLRYVWMDFFRSQAEMTYIQAQHRSLGSTPGTLPHQDH